MQRNLMVSNALLRLLTLPKDKQKNILFSDMYLLSDNKNSAFDYNSDTNLYRQLLWQQWQQYWSQYQGIQNSVQKNAAEQASASAQISKLTQTLPIINRRVKKVKKLYDQKYASEDEYLTLEQERIEATPQSS
jgi:hemolysin D